MNNMSDQEKSVSYKVCRSCNNVKPHGEFYVDREKSDGRKCYCKTCSLKRTHAYLKRGGNEVQRAYQQSLVGKATRRRYATSEKGKRSNYKRHKRYVEKHPQKSKAHHKVSNAVASKSLSHVSTQKCAHCGKVAEDYHHHKGYSDDHLLSLMPLCKECHKNEHS